MKRSAETGIYIQIMICALPVTYITMIIIHGVSLGFATGAIAEWEAMKMAITPTLL